jgi:hypothetical protein
MTTNTAACYASIRLFPLWPIVGRGSQGYALSASLSEAQHKVFMLSRPLRRPPTKEHHP